MTEQAQYISGRTVQEQMDNLIKYVDDRSKTVAEEEAQRVLVPAENAKVAAEAAADRAVGSVRQFESRLGAVEDGVAGNRSSIQTIDGEITDIYNDLTNVVRKVGEAGQVVMNGLDLRGNNSVPDTVIGQNDSKPANGKRIIRELNAYEPMMRTTGISVRSGGVIIQESTDASVRYIAKSTTHRIADNQTTAAIPRIGFVDADNMEIATILSAIYEDGHTTLSLRVRNSNGTYSTVILGEGSH